MRGAPTFAETLDAALKSHDINSYRPSGAAGPRPEPASAPAVELTAEAEAPVLASVSLAQATQRFAARAFGSVAGALGGAARRVRSAGERPRHVPASRPLTADERRAIDALISHGASLQRDFTTAELQSEFRSLARRYHPDRHPHACNGEKARLGTVFAELTAHYRRLLASGR